LICQLLSAHHAAMWRRLQRCSDHARRIPSRASGSTHMHSQALGHLEALVPRPSSACLLNRNLRPPLLGVRNMATADVADEANAELVEAKPELVALLTLLQELRQAETPQISRLEAVNAQLTKGVVDWPLEDRLELIRGMSRLGAVPGRPYPIGNYFLMFLEEYGPNLGALRDGETIWDRADELRDVLRSFHQAGIGTERLRLIYEHVEHEFPRFEAAGALLPMPEAVQLCHTMLSTGQSSSGAIIVLLRSALREPLVTVADDAIELRLLKMIEILIRLDYLHTQEQLPRDVSEYLSVVRDLRYYDRAIRRDTALSYQLGFFLRKHGFPSKRHMLGPYALKVCDPEERINFEPAEEREFRPGMTEAPTARKRRHLEAVGWRTFEVHASEWEELATYERKAAHIRSMLKENDLLST